jgi:D-sedoheptulose 7-phosphate isomerase
MSTIDFSWIENYLNKYKQSIFDKNIYGKLLKAKELFEKTSSNGGKIIVAGNGGSAAIASHCSVDLTKNAGIKAINFNEADFYADNSDVVVLISSSGNSKNILKAADKALVLGLDLVTFSGFSSSNFLCDKGMINFWVESEAYNVVEMTHHVWLLTIVDMIIGKAEYSA